MAELQVKEQGARSGGDHGGGESENASCVTSGQLIQNVFLDSLFYVGYGQAVRDC